MCHAQLAPQRQWVRGQRAPVQELLALGQHAARSVLPPQRGRRVHRHLHMQIWLPLSMSHTSKSDCEDRRTDPCAEVLNKDMARLYPVLWICGCTRLVSLPPGERRLHACMHARLGPRALVLGVRQVVRDARAHAQDGLQRGRVQAEAERVRGDARMQRRRTSLLPGRPHGQLRAQAPAPQHAAGRGRLRCLRLRLASSRCPACRIRKLQKACMPGSSRYLHPSSAYQELQETSLGCACEMQRAHTKSS